MVKVTTYKQRSGPAIPVMDGATSKGTIIFSFGSETQEVITECSTETNFLGSNDMCLLGGEYYSAQYRAFPGKINNKLVFNSVLNKKPVSRAEIKTEGECSGGGNGGGNLAPVA